MWFSKELCACMTCTCEVVARMQSINMTVTLKIVSGPPTKYLEQGMAYNVMSCHAIVGSKDQKR